MAAVEERTREKRVSKVYRVGSAPHDARERGRGLIHDQIWFYDVPSVNSRIDLTPAEGGAERWGRGHDTSPVYHDGRHYWRKEHPHSDADARWLRLYMDRRMIWTRNMRYRVHTFYSGDDDSAPHDHPWSFWTFPLRDYLEVVEVPTGEVHHMLRDGSALEVIGDERWSRVTRRVRALRPHFRPAEYRHYVLEPERPFSTLVVARRGERKWGFWPSPEEFVPFDEWTTYE